MTRLAAILCLLCLQGCWWRSSQRLPDAATDSGLSSAESRLDHLTDKRDSRVAAAVSTAKGASTEDAVIAELSVAEAMLPPPTSADLAFARERLERGDDSFYAQQVAVSRALASEIIAANKRYEAEKARKQAEYESRLKEKEMALAAEQEARQADKWTYAGIVLTAIGLLAAFLTPMRASGLGVAASGLVVGAFPVLSKQPWFAPSVGGLVLLAIVAALILNRRKAPAADAQTPPQG